MKYRCLPTISPERFMSTYNPALAASLVSSDNDSIWASATRTGNYLITSTIPNTLSFVLSKVIATKFNPAFGFLSKSEQELLRNQSAIKSFGEHA